MAAVANVAVTLDATGVVQRLRAIQQSSVAAADGLKQLSDRAKAVKAIVEAQQGGFAKASSIQGVFAAKVRNTEQAILSQINALRQVQSQVQLGGALYQKAQQQIQQYEQILRQAKGTMDATAQSTEKASSRFSIFGNAISGLVLRLTAGYTAVKVFGDSLNVAFERGTAEQRLKNITGSTEEYNAAIALASQSAQRFGLTQTESTKALGDVYSRLKGVGFGLKETGEIYQGFNTIALRSGLAGQEAAGAFFQLSQALGKGKLNGDEFVTISERMPQLLDAIADATGRSRGELTKMAGSGEITSQVLYQALSKAAGASENLRKNLTEQQKAMIDLRQAADKVMFSIGKAFEPLVIAGVRLLTDAVQSLGGMIVYLREPLAIANKAFLFLVENAKVLVQIIGGFAAAVLTFKALGVATQVWAKATAGLALAKKAAAAAAATLQAIINPATLVKTAAAVAAGTAVYFGLSKVIDGAAQNAQKLANEQANAQTNTAGLLQKFSSLPEPIRNAKDETKELVASIEAGRFAVQDLENSLNFTVAAMEQQAGFAKKMADMQIQVNNLEIKRLESILKGTKNLGDQLKIIESIRKVEIANAKIAYESAKAQIKLEKELARIEVSRQHVKLKNLEIDLKIARAKGEEVGGFIAAYNAGVDAINLAERNLTLVEKTADMQFKVAAATYNSAVQAANMKAQVSSTEARTRALADAARQTAQGMNAAADATMRMQKATNWQILSKVTDPAEPGYRAVRINEQGRKETVSTYLKGTVQFFGEGGYVNKATPAVVGENGGEYIVPASKVNGFIENYLSGARGSQAVPAGATGGGPITIQTGPVMQQDGTRYVTLGDMEQALSVLASNLLGNNRSTGGRRFQGV